VIAKVEPLTQARALRGPFDYRVPEEMEAGVGSVLLVPFGRRRILGVVVDTAETSDVPPDKLV
jgi:primosomal protein N' (replication factor Y)